MTRNNYIVYNSLAVNNKKHFMIRSIIGKIEISEAETLSNSRGKKQNRLVIDEGETKYRFATVSEKIFKDPLYSTKETCWQRCLRALKLRNWVIIRVEDRGWVKVNAESLRKRLGLDKKTFNIRVKTSIDFTEEVLAKINPPPDEEFHKLASPHPDSYDRIQNTGLTSMLAPIAFSADLPIPPDFNDLLKRLADAAKNNNPHAKAALITPNNAGEIIDDMDFPQNTPLLLLVKMGHSEGVKSIVQVYETPDLMAVTPRGNSALHLAIITGQWNMAVEILKRASELAILDDVLAMKNRAGNTADDMLKIVSERRSQKLFNNYLDIVDPLLGGEELNKARMGGLTTKFHVIRTRLYCELDGKNPLGTIKEEFLKSA